MAISTVTTNFFGICTHFALGGNVEGPSLYRVVLADASTEDIITNSRLFGLDPPVQPHFARLQLRVDDIVTATDLVTKGFTIDRVLFDETGEVAIVWNLDNILLSIGNAQPGLIEVDTACLPHLSHLCSDLGLASPIMTFNPIPTRAAAFFDITSGKATAFSFGSSGNEACVGQITNKTVGLPQLRVRSFAPDTSDANVLSITLNDGALITISNAPSDPLDDADNDFLIHFLNAAAFPEGAHAPGPCTCAAPLFPPDYKPTIRTDNIPFNGGPETTTPSCSNSTFP